jgi:hypothetical protein
LVPTSFLAPMAVPTIGPQVRVAGLKGIIDFCNMAKIYFHIFTKYFATIGNVEFCKELLEMQ